MRTRRTPVIAVVVVLLTGVTAAVLLHSQSLNGRRRAVTTGQVTHPLAGNPSTTRSAQPGTTITAPVIGLTTWRWTGFHGIALPVSAQDGPRRTRGGLASGFTDSPAGALLATINIAVRTAAQWGPAIYTPTISRQVTGPAAAALLQADTAAYTQLRAAAHVPPGQPAGRGYAAVTAYQFVAYTPAGATVDVVTAGPGSGDVTALAVTRIEVVWLRGDWQVLAPPGGDWASAATAISSLSGYRIFPGEG
jgi:hypothetical protein